MAYAAVAVAAAGAIVSTIGNLIKTKVKADNAPILNAGDEAAKATGANLANLGGIEQLASATNEFKQSELLKLIKSVVPNFDELSKNISTQVGNQVQGILPQEEINRVLRKAGVEQFNSGGGNDQYGINFTNRDIGRSVVDEINMGVQNSNSWLANVRQNLTAPQYDPSSMFVTPAMQLATTAENNKNIWNIGFLQKQLNASQSTASIIGSGLDQFGKSLGSMGSLGGLGNGS